MKNPIYILNKKSKNTRSEWEKIENSDIILWPILHYGDTIKVSKNVIYGVGMIINREIINLLKMFFLGFRNHTTQLIYKSIIPTVFQN